MNPALGVNHYRGKTTAGMAIDKYLADGEWWDPNAPKPKAAPAANRGRADCPMHLNNVLVG